MYKLSLTLDGDISLETFREAISNFVGMLHEVDRTVSGGISVRWRLADYTHGSPATISCIGEPRSRRKREAAELPAVIGETVISGIDKLERGEGRPKGFSDMALDAARRLVHLKARRVNRLAISGERSDRAQRARSLDLTERVAASINELIGPKYAAPGSVEGTLEAINSHGMLYFNLYESVWGGRVRCDIPEKLKVQALEAFDRRVLVKGRVTTDVEGHPRYVAVEAIEVFPSRDALPQSLRGLDRDYTEGLDSSEYLKRRWT